MVAGLAVGAAAYAGKAAIEIFTRYRGAPRLRQFYKVHLFSSLCIMSTAVFLSEKAPYRQGITCDVTLPKASCWVPM